MYLKRGEYIPCWYTKLGSKPKLAAAANASWHGERERGGHFRRKSGRSAAKGCGGDCDGDRKAVFNGETRRAKVING